MSGTLLAMSVGNVLLLSERLADRHFLSQLEAFYRFLNCMRQE